MKKERGKRKAFEFRILSFSFFIVLSILKLRKRIRTDFVRRAHVKMAIASVPVATLAEVSAAIDSGDISRGTIASDDVDNSRSEANESVNWTTSSGPPISGPLHGASLFSLSVWLICFVCDGPAYGFNCSRRAFFSQFFHPSPLRGVPVSVSNYVESISP